MCATLSRKVDEYTPLPHGMLMGAKVSVADMMMNNILPVTLGNIVGR